ncbi:glycosyl hydrolase 115 family protein [Pseudozobellia thermophila]|uniref:S-layer like family, C-terminal region n=1 Tax=Pseudozobellia thermophila TaxID=192903 RepID=A0A1M6FZZ7_9FLAO|nr:glycosyl hydrolase 115 family protein [Pseudozobellia thermophila]SHJ03260.1 S-layer like family, C-terminal region [Pseudozobellia thermophila]
MAKPFRIHKILLPFIMMATVSVHSFSTELVPSCFLVIGKKADAVELDAVRDLQADLGKTLSVNVEVVTDMNDVTGQGTIIILGTPRSNPVIASLHKSNKIRLTDADPGPRGGIWAKIDWADKRDVIVIAGSDVQGLQYAIYDYSKEVLGVDPLEYWTGKEIVGKKPEDLFAFENRRIAPPKVPILCYFENDVDELANYRGKLLQYDWESYTEMINALVRLRYNAIQFFDMLGRPEFFIRPEYKKMTDYQVDVAYLEKMIDYAQKKGMKVAIDFALGYQIHPMSADKATCWKDYKQDWLTAWRFYLEKTPLHKTDIFILRPRHQVWDWEYESSCGENKIAVFNEVYKAFGDLVDEYRPGADKVLVCYSDGMEMWNNGFRPPNDWTVAWSDHGFGDFEHLPNTTDNYSFGTYMHAGFWLNHTVHNPYPGKVESVMKNMFATYDADKFCLVNGQNFRPFLLNLEAYSQVCADPESFDADGFYKAWTERYFNVESARHAVASMKYLHKAQAGRIGYVQHLWEIGEAISYLSDSPIERPGKSPVPHDYKRVENDLEHVKETEKFIDSAVREASMGMRKATSGKVFYHDYVYLPAVLYQDLIRFERTLHRMSIWKRQYEETGDPEMVKAIEKMLPRAKKQLKEIYKHRKRGDKAKKWEHWYAPEIRRPNNGFPTFEMLEAIDQNLKTINKPN